MGLINRIRGAALVFVFVVMAGTIGFRLLEDDPRDLLDSFFFTLITVTTVGYGNIVPHTTPGKVLAIGIILTGVGSAMVALQGIFEVLVGRRIKEELNLPQKETKKKDHLIVCGYSMVGKAIIRSLRERGLDFIVIEQDKGKVGRMVEAGVPVIEGDARDEKVLERAGVRQAQYLLAALDDSNNVFITLTAKLLNPEILIVSKTEDTANTVKLKKAGADEVVACHDVGAKMMVDKAVLNKGIGKK
jgi:voltage-gated potassium channel